MPNENEEVVVPAEAEGVPEVAAPLEEAPAEDAKPVGEATIVELESPAEQFPTQE